MQPDIFIMSGISGAGKSTESERIASTYGGLDYVFIFSADHFFMHPTPEPGKYEYKFDPRLLSQAHGQCLLKFTDAVYVNRDQRRDCRAIIVDNTNLSAVEMAPYVALGTAVGCKVEIVTVLCDPEVAARRNVHGVPAEAVRRMNLTLSNRHLPTFWNVTKRTVVSSSAA